MHLPYSGETESSGTFGFGLKVEDVYLTVRFSSTPKVVNFQFRIEFRIQLRSPISTSDPLLLVSDGEAISISNWISM